MRVSHLRTVLTRALIITSAWPAHPQMAIEGEDRLRDALAGGTASSSAQITQA